MPTTVSLEVSTPWQEVTTSQRDWDDADPVMLRSLFAETVLIRVFEEFVLDLAAKGLIHGPAHSSIGQEGAAVASIAHLRTTDRVNGSHRGHHQFLAKVVRHLHPDGLDPRQPWSTELRTAVLRTLAEICGLARGFCAGRGGSMHLQWPEAGAMGTNAIVGGAVPQAAGFAWAGARSGDGSVAVSYFGDGAVNIGSVLETFNLAAAWKLPVCFFIENNQYAVATTVEEATGEPRLSARGPGFGIPAWRVDGMDPLAVHLVMEQAITHMRAGKGPTVVEADVYRYFHQSGPFPGSAFGYRDKDEEARWRQRDPIMLLEEHLLRRELLTADEIAQVRERTRATIAEIGDELLEADPEGGSGARRIRPAEWPDAAFVDHGIRSDLREFEGARFAERTEYAGGLREEKFIAVVAEVMHRRMETDGRIVLLGEDIHRLKGGVNGATRGLAESFPGRVLGTPISENAFVGLAGGLALDGRYRPVVEFMFPDFMWVAADQVFNQIGKLRHMFGGRSPVPLVLRTKVAMGTGYGSQHSMDPAGIFATAPGWRIVAPSTPFDYVGLMNSALRCDDPVLVLEHVDLYAATGEIPDGDLDYCLPVGTANCCRTGNAVTVISYLSMTGHVLDAVERTGVDADVIDLRWLDRASLDWDLLGESIRRTNAVLVVEQGAVGTSYGGWLADEIHRRFFDWLDHPVERVHGSESAPSISKVLERAAFAGPEEIVSALAKFVGQ